MRYRLNSDGTKTPIAGRGRAEYGASTIRTGTFTNPEVGANNYAIKTITFDTPMPDADYELSFEKETNSLCYIEVVSKAAASFVVRFIRPYTGGTILPANDSTWDYTAFKLYTDTEYNKLLTVQSGTTSDEHITWKRSGNVVTVSVYGLAGTGSNVNVTGLPKCSGYVLSHMVASGTTTPTGAIQIVANDTYAKIMGVPNGTTVYGSVTYITSDPL